MYLPYILTGAALIILALPVASAQDGAGYFNNVGKLGIVSSSHQDTAWMDTPEFCRNYRVEQIIVPALDLMKKDPGYCFAMECTLHLMEFLEAHPERRAEIVRLTKEGRLEWGATYNQPYEAWLSGEELVRQTYYGRRWILKNLPGCDARVAYNPDVPGRAIQMQQILSKAGIPYLFTSRYHEGLYRWLSPDGSGVIAYTPGHYGNHMEMLNKKPEESVLAISKKLEEQGAYYQKRSLPPVYCLVNSMDFSQPKDFSELIAAWNEQPKTNGAPPVMGYTPFVKFFDQIAAVPGKLDKLMGERPDVWLYIQGPTHHWTSSKRREAAKLLPAAETFATAACLLKKSFTDWPRKQLDAAWMDEIYMDHGIGGKNGHITDRVFDDKITNARDTGRKLLNKSLHEIASKVKVNSRLGTPITVFNTLSWMRSDPVEVKLPANVKGPVHVVDGEGRETTCQITVLDSPAEVNVALVGMGATAKSSSQYNDVTGGNKAIDGKWALRDVDKWASAAGAGPHMLTIDFGEARDIHRVVIRHDSVLGVFGDEGRYTTSDFTIQGALSADGPWIDLVPAVIGNVAALTSHPFANRNVRYLRVTVQKGTPTGGDGSARIFEVQAFADAPVKERKLLFAARHVPAMGYKTWYLKPGEGKAAKQITARTEGVENEFYHLKLVPGGIKSIYDKTRKRELLNTGKFLGGEIFTMTSVAPDNRGAGTDAGEFGSFPLPVMDATYDKISNHKPHWSVLENGPIRTVYGMELPWKNTVVQQHTVIWHTINRIDCEANLKEFNGELWREFRMAFPLALKKPQISYEVPMGVVRIGMDEIPTTGGHAYGNLNYTDQCRDIHPREIQNFIDASDATGGLTLTSSVSVLDWVDPTGANTSTVLQPILLATRKSCNGEGVWYPQAGDHSYRFSITTHDGGWQNGWRTGIQPNNALEAVMGVKPASGASLPTSMSFFSSSAKNVTITAVKKAEDDDSVVMRCVDVEGKTSNVTLKTFIPIRQAVPTNIIEETNDDAKRGKLTIVNGGVTLNLGHHAIETIKLK